MGNVRIQRRRGGRSFVRVQKENYSASLKSKGSSAQKEKNGPERESNWLSRPGVGGGGGTPKQDKTYGLI